MSDKYQAIIDLIRSGDEINWIIALESARGLYPEEEVKFIFNNAFELLAEDTDLLSIRLSILMFQSENKLIELVDDWRINK